MPAKSKDISLAQAAEILTTAFAPLRCAVSEIGFGSGLKASVCDDPAVEPVCRITDIPLAIALYSRELRDLIEHARANVKAKGYTLAPWTFAIPQAKKPLE